MQNGKNKIDVDARHEQYTLNVTTSKAVAHAAAGYGGWSGKQQMC